MDPSLPRPAPRLPLAERLRDWVVWFGPARLAATALAVVAVAAGGMWLVKGSPSRPEDALPFATRSATTVTLAGAAGAAGTAGDPDGPMVTNVSTPSSIVVYVTGDVTAPGVYTLASPARVNDAVSAAGGAGSNADLAVVNLAAAVHDG